MRNWTFLRAALFSLVLSGPGSAAPPIRVMFDLTSPDIGPFPNDALTVADSAQKTGVRINLPLPDCQLEPSTCQELGMINQLDGFSIEPRLRVRFSGPINPDTLRDGIFLVWLDDLTNEESDLGFGTVTSINSVSYDQATNTAYAEPNEILSQHRQYALVVTDAVRDTNGEPVGADPDFLACVGSRELFFDGRQPGAQRGAECERLAGALGRLVLQIPPPRHIIGGSVFTTMSITAWLESARAAIQKSAVNFRRAQPQSVFYVANLSALVLKAETRVNTFTDVPLTILTQLGGVDRIAFGSFWSPNFLNQNQMILSIPTGQTVELPVTSRELFFQVYLPAIAAPPGGYPVVIVGHGVAGNRFQQASALASTMAAKGIAVIGMNAVGSGYGPATRLGLTDKLGTTVEIPAAGLSVDMNGDGKYDSPEGCTLLSPPNVVGWRDCARQTALDTMQLLRAIRDGMDLDGDGKVDLNGDRIFYAGLSQGGVFGTILTAVESDIQAAVLTSAPGSVADTFRWVKEGPYLTAAIGAMSTRMPPLFNAGPNGFNYDWPLRDEPVRIINVTGAIALQEYLERAEWSQLPGDPLGYARQLQSKRVLFQFGIGDTTAPNPCESSLVRAAYLREMTSVYRHDLARAFDPTLPRNPHGLFYSATTALGQVITKAAQQQMSEFFASGIASVPDVNYLVWPTFGQNLFEVPQVLPEALNYLP